MKPRNLQEALKDKLTEEEFTELGRAFDIIGDIAILKMSGALLPKKQLIGEALMSVHHNIKTILLQTSPVKGEYRTRNLEHVAGENRTETIHAEHGCKLKVDIAKTYFSPRLATERLRTAKLVKPGETIINMFAGVGSYSIIIAKHSQAAKIYSIDLNPSAVEYMTENIRINKFGSRIIPIFGDAREVIETHLKKTADRVIMPLPENAKNFLDSAVKALKPSGGIIHLYDFGQEPDLFGPTLKFAREAIPNREIELAGKSVVRTYAPKTYHIVLDIAVSRE